MGADHHPPSARGGLRRPNQQLPADFSPDYDEYDSPASELRKRPSRQLPRLSDAHEPNALPRLDRRSSKMSLFNLFSRPKVERARGHHESGLPSLPEFTGPRPPLAIIQQQQQQQQLQLQQQFQQQQQQFQSRSILRVASAAMSPHPSRSSSVSTKRPSNWTPPPLFQAYPQAIKHATLSTSIPSAEAVLKIQQSRSTRRPYSLLQDKLDSRSRVDLSDPEPEEEGRQRARLSSKRLSSAMLPFMPENNKKIYILITSGYVLQYAGDGPFDRLPEKMLPLGPESAAFASDLIPGKHWVLQISQVANEDGTVAAGQTRSLLSKLRLQNANARRHASNFLLILESAEEMDSWLTAVRREIDTLGGANRKDAAEVKASAKLDAAEPKPAEHPTHRYNVQRDPKRFSTTPSSAINGFPHQSPNGSPRVVTSDWDNSTQRGASISSSRDMDSRRTSMRQSVEMFSPASTAVSSDHGHFSSAGSRLSTISTGTTVSGTVTIATSHGSSPSGSPRSESFSRSETSSVRTKQSPSTPNNRRLSMQSLTPTDEHVAAATRDLQNAIRRPSSDVVIEESQEEDSPQSSPEVSMAQMKRTRSPRPRVPSAASNRSVLKYRSSSLPPPQCPLPPIPGESPRLENGRSPSAMGSHPNLTMLSSRHSIRRSPSPIPPTIAEDVTDEVADVEKLLASPPKSGLQPAADVPSTTEADSATPLAGQPDRRMLNFSLPTLLSENSTPRHSRPISRIDSATSIPATGRSASGPKPYFRPVPIRASDNRTSRRNTSLLPPPIPLPVSVSTVNSPNRKSPVLGAHSPHLMQLKTLKRPTSMQIGSDKTPFLAAARGNSGRSVSASAGSTPIMPSAPKKMTAYDILAPPPYAALKSQRSMPNLPPVGPPPDMPLPAPPLPMVVRQIAV